MSLSIKKTYLNALTLKFFALIFGYGLWHSVSTHQKIQIARAIPLCFYNTNPNQTISAPETITVTCYGTRKDLFNTAMDSAIHCNAQNLQEGTQAIALTKEQIFLPESVRLVHYKPAEITVTIHKND